MPASFLSLKEVLAIILLLTIIIAADELVGIGNNYDPAQHPVRQVGVTSVIWREGGRGSSLTEAKDPA